MQMPTITEMTTNSYCKHALCSDKEMSKPYVNLLVVYTTDIFYYKINVFLLCQSTLRKH